MGVPTWDRRRPPRSGGRPVLPPERLRALFNAPTTRELRARGTRKWPAGEDLLGLYVAEMDFGIPPVVTEAIQPAVASGTLGHLPEQDRSALRAAVADYQLRHHGWAVSPGDVHLVADVMTALSVTIEHFSAPGAPVVLLTPTYAHFRTLATCHGREVIEVPCAPDAAAGRYALDLAGLDVALARARGGLVVLSNPWEPVGRVLEREELLDLADVVERHGARVFADELHAPLVVCPGRRHVPYASLDARTAGHTVTGVGASVGWNIPGLKCGQMILSNAAVAARFAPLARRYVEAVGVLGVRAATAAYTRGEPWIDEIRGYLRGNHDLLASAVAGGRLPGLRLTPLEGTYSAWLDCRDLDLPGGPAAYFRERAGVALTDGATCGSAGAGFVRMILGTPRPIIEQAIARMSAALAGCARRAPNG